MEFVSAVILAAGEGKRMQSKYSKVVHQICQKPLVKWVYRAVKDAGVSESIIVVGHRADQVRECMGIDVLYAVQEKQLGTGHAVMQANEYLKGKKGIVLVLCGDTPLITSETLSAAIQQHKDTNSFATVITAILDDPTGYGRIIRSEKGEVLKIVEQKDASEEEKSIREVNSGMYCFSIEHLLDSLSKLSNDNSQGEFYLTDTLEIMMSQGLKVSAYTSKDANEILGINDRVQLAQAEKIMNSKINEGFMRKGVTIVDTASTYIDVDAQIGMDTVIFPNTIIEKACIIGEDCVIGPNSKLVASSILDRAEINNSVVLKSSIGEDSHVGPYAYIRPGSKIGKHVKIGDFVEIKNSQIGDETKISHLTYVGDAIVGQNVNLGCGVVFVNYDGKNKNTTIVEDNAFIGCNSNLVSPVVVKKGAYVAAGSTITDEVPESSLAIARCRQTNKENWVINKGRQR